MDFSSQSHIEGESILKRDEKSILAKEINVSIT
jgi:hypothetical protein